jgi:hypothetical protein
MVDQRTVVMVMLLGLLLYLLYLMMLTSINILLVYACSSL